LRTPIAAYRQRGRKRVLVENVRFLVDYRRRTSASVSVVIVISHLDIDQDVSRFASGTVRGHYPIPVIVESCRPRNVGRRT
jgi:hypothetical protein